MNIKHHTWDILDASKIQTFMRCERKFFFSYIMGWKPQGKSIHLIHGEAWHRAIEQILLHGYTKEGRWLGYEAYMNYYNQFYTKFQWEANQPKDPGTTNVALQSYINEYKNKDKDLEVIATEVAGSIKITEEKSLHFRLDSIIRNQHGKIISLEHKTGTRNTKQWKDSWLMKTQIALYTHVLYTLYSPQEVYGIVVNGTFFYKSQAPANIRIPIKKDKNSMRVWLNHTLHRMNMIQWETDRLLSDDKPDNDIMFSFPTNTEACTDYGGCPFIDLCMTCPNPLKYVDKGQPPLGFEVEWWNPADREEDATTIFKDGKLEKKK